MIVIIALMTLLIGIVMMIFVINKTPFSQPKPSDFSLQINYDEKRHTVIAELYNFSDHDYTIMANGAKTDFIQFHILCDSTEIPSNQLLLLSTIVFPKNSCIKRELSLNDAALSGKCKIYAETAFYINDPDTSEKYEFKLTSDSVNITLSK